LFFTDYSLGLLGLYDSCWKYIFETNSQHSKIYDVCNISQSVIRFEPDK
jgi:hypothetical protein